MSLDKHKALTPVRAEAYGELFGCTPSAVFPPHALFNKPDERFHIDIFVYTLGTGSGDIDVAVTNGMSDQRIADPGRPHEWKRRELIQYLPKCTEGHARRLHDMAWLPLFDNFYLDSRHSVAWEHPAVAGTPWKNAFFLLPRDGVSRDCRRRRLEDEMKATVEEIRRRFDADVERFSNLETGQSATVDAPLAMALVAEAAAATTPHARHVLDVGCGAGNYTLKLLERLPGLDATLIDLSQPMLDRARERVSRAAAGRITTVQADIREAKLPDGEFDIVLAAAVLHHLRTDQEWRDVFMAFHRALRPGGSVWVFDLVESSIPAIQGLMRRRYGEYLTGLKGEAYRDHVFAYVEKEDTPRPLLFQLDLLRQVGFSQIEVLHKNVCFAAFGAVKG